MCFWGEALAHGPNINAPMDAAVNARAVGLAAYANWLARKGTPAERALTAAMLKRYSPNANADRAALDAAYADAMLAAAKAHPAHDDIALLAAEAAMDTKPWDYWTADKQLSWIANYLNRALTTTQPDLETKDSLINPRARSARPDK